VSAKTHVELGEAYAEKGLIQDAIIEFEQALQLDPDCARARTGLDAARARLEGGIPDDVA
jgi:hypothetical protein